MVQFLHGKMAEEQAFGKELRTEVAQLRQENSNPEWRAAYSTVISFIEEYFQLDPIQPKVDMEKLCADIDARQEEQGQRNPTKTGSSAKKKRSPSRPRKKGSSSTSSRKKKRSKSTSTKKASRG